MQTLRDNPGFAIEDEQVIQHPRAAAPPRDPALATQMLQIALGALSQRAVVALASLFSVVLAASVFALYWKVLPNPSVESLVGLGLYALFVLALVYLRYRK